MVFMFFILLEMATNKTRTFKRVHDENECACITFGGTINIFTYTVLVRFVYGKIIYIHIDIYIIYREENAQMVENCEPCLQFSTLNHV